MMSIEVIPLINKHIHQLTLTACRHLVLRDILGSVAVSTDTSGFSSDSEDAPPAAVSAVPASKAAAAINTTSSAPAASTSTVTFKDQEAINGASSSGSSMSHSSSALIREAAAGPDDGPATETSPEPQPSHTFPWTKQWWPLIPLDYLDPGRPTGLTVLGLPLVIWWDGQRGEWRAFKDSCPHRLAPLSGKSSWMHGAGGAQSPTRPQNTSNA